MRIKCPFCRHKAKIYGHPRPRGRIEELYCHCLNEQCCARFVYRAYYSHTLQPPLADLTDSLHEQIARLEPQTRADLLKTYAPELPLFAP